jgi:hypothetical protein
MAVNWVNPTMTMAGFAVKNHKELGGIVTAVWNRLTKTPTELAITGTEGVGKSVLLDNLTGKAFEQGYTKPRKSQREEQGAVQSKQRIRASVVPGQLSSPRYESLDELFGGQKQVDGVIHVVSAGLPLIREDAHRQQLVDHQVTTIREYRSYHRGVELNDLKETCDKIRTAHRRYHSPKWLIVAVDKIDLFHDKVLEEQQYYSPHHDSEFTRILNDLQNNVGKDNFRWTAVPVCGWPEDFEWNGEVLPSHMTAEARQAYLAQFLGELESYCQ